MRILFDIGHPAHFHLFRNLIDELSKRGHDSEIATRDKDVVVKLIQEYGFKFKVISKQQQGTWGLFKEYVEHSYRFYEMARSFKPHLLIGCTPSVSLVSKIFPAKSIIFSEDDPESVWLASLLTYPLADFICMPDVIKSPWPKRISYSGYHKLAYLHPNYFCPNPGILDELGIKTGGKYFLLRFVSLKAAHDFKATGLSMAARRSLVDLLSQHGKVFISTEGQIAPEFKHLQLPTSPKKIHDVMAFASLFVGDSQSMTTEAALLGTPAMRCSTFVGRCSVIEEVEKKYGLAFGFLPSQEEEMIALIKQLLQKENLREEWRQKRDQLLKDKIDVTQWMVDFVEHFDTNSSSLKG